MKINTNKGVTLLEIVVAMLILATIMAGLVNVSISGKRYILHTRNRGVGGALGRMFLDPLHMAVRQDTWGDANSPLAVGTRYCDGTPQQPNCPSGLDRRINNIPYQAQYDISSITAGGINLRRVELTLTWNDTTP